MQQDRPFYSLHFELLIDALALILTKLSQFQNLTYFLPRDLLTWPLILKHYKLLHWVKIHLWVKNSEDMSKRSWSMRENVLISFKHEYRRLILSSWCDVTGDVISMIILFLESFAYYRSMSVVNWGYLWKFWKSWNFQKWRNFEVLANFFVGSVTGNWVCYIDSQAPYWGHGGFLHQKLYRNLGLKTR